ncbi:hypothetical protein EDB84DRAFT_1447048, partial [Lactarius hengduanensis]
AQRVQVSKNEVPSSSSGTSWLDAIGIPSILRQSWLRPKPQSVTSTTPQQSHRFSPGSSPCAIIDAFWQTETGNIVVTPFPGAIKTKPTLPFFGMTPLSSTHHMKAAGVRAHPTRLPKKDKLTDYLDPPVSRPTSPFASVSSAKGLSPSPGHSPPDPFVYVIQQLHRPPTSGAIDRPIGRSTPCCRRIAALDATAPEPTLSAKCCGLNPVSNSASEHSCAFVVGGLKSLVHECSISSADPRLARPNPDEVSPAPAPVSACRRDTGSPQSPPPGLRHPSPPSSTPPPFHAGARRDTQAANGGWVAHRSVVPRVRKERNDDNINCPHIASGYTRAIRITWKL